jgi:hypothetical protein
LCKVRAGKDYLENDRDNEPSALGNRQRGVVAGRIFWPTDYEHGRDFIADLDKFLGQLLKGWPYGVEMRNRNWLKPEYFECLARHQVAHVYNSWDAMPPVGEQMAPPGSRTNPDLVAARLLLEDFDFLLKVLDGILLVAIDQASQAKEEKLKMIHPGRIGVGRQFSQKFGCSRTRAFVGCRIIVSLSGNASFRTVRVAWKPDRVRLVDHPWQWRLTSQHDSNYLASFPPAPRRPSSLSWLSRRPPLRIANEAYSNEDILSYKTGSNCGAVADRAVGSRGADAPATSAI